MSLSDRELIELMDFDPESRGIPAEALAADRGQVDRVARDFFGQMQQLGERAKSGALSAADAGRFEKAERVYRNLVGMADDARYQRAQAGAMPSPLMVDGRNESAADFEQALRALVAREVTHVDVPLVGHMIANRTIGQYGEVKFPEVRDLLTSTSGTTEFVGFANRVVVKMVESSAVLRTNATVIRTDHGGDFKYPVWNEVGTAAATSEGSAIGTVEPTPEEVTLSAYKAAGLAFVTNELLDDSPVSLEAPLASSLSRAVANQVGPWMATGTGTVEPTGVESVAWTGNADTGGTGQAGIPTADELIDLVHGLSSPYRGNGASFLMNSTTKAAIAKIEDSGGNRLYLPNLAAGVPGTLLGYPVYDDAYFSAAGTGVESIYFGDWSDAYAIRFAGPLRISRSEDYRFNEDIVAVRATQRIDGNGLFKGAIATYTGGAS